MVQLVEIGWRGSHGNNFQHFAKWPFGFLTMALMVFDNQGKNRKSWVISGGIGAGGGRGGGGSKGGGRWWQWQLQRNLENYFFPIWIQNWNQFLWCCWSRFGPRLSPGPGGLTSSSLHSWINSRPETTVFFPSYKNFVPNLCHFNWSFCDCYCIIHLLPWLFYFCF